MKHTPLLPSLALVATVACGKVCTTELVPGITLRLDPAVTNAVVTVTDGSFTETVNVTPGAAWVDLVHERPGTYRVEVHAADFASWSVSNVRVEEDDCHVITVELTADLVPAAG